MDFKERKINEARYFIDRMKNNYDDLLLLEYNFSAFLSAARSVLQFIYEDVKNIPLKKGSYIDEVSKNKIIQFFKDKRDTNIHIMPTAIDSRSVTIFVGTQYVILGEETDNNRNWTPPKSESVNKIKNWEGTEQEIINACEVYIKEICDFVACGKSKGFVS